MFLLLLPVMLAVSLAAAAQETKEICKTCVKLNDECHNITHLLDFKGNFREEIVISELGILYNKNRLYYTFQPAIADPEYYKLGYVDLDSPDTQGILRGESKEDINFATFDIDQTNQMIYIGSQNGIQKASFVGNATHFSSYNDTIIKVFFRKYVFFVRYGENIIIKKDGDNFENYIKFEKVKDFVIDKNDYVVFLNTSGLYANKINTNSNDTVKLSKNVFFRGLTTDKHGDVYAWWIDGIYKVKLESNIMDSKIVKIANIASIGAVTFDKDNNFLFTFEKGLYRLDLVQSNTTTC